MLISCMDQVSLGAEISVAAGPIGRSASAAGTVNMDIQMAPILSYSHSRGLFAGISLEGILTFLLVSTSVAHTSSKVSFASRSLCQQKVWTLISQVVCMLS